MEFSKRSILDMDVSDISDDERKYLLQKYFPEVIPDWKRVLEDAAIRIQEKNVWDTYEKGRYYGDLVIDLRLDHAAVLRLACAKPPRAQLGRDVRVTDFSGWIFSLYTPPPSPYSLGRGKEVEKSIARLAPVPRNTDYELVYEDQSSRARLSVRPRALKISSLTYNGNPIWGVPDLVLRHKTTGHIIIVERKASDSRIPICGWPNLRAQLWAYGHCDLFSSAPSISLVGEIWSLSENKLIRRAIIRWSRDDGDFDSENLELFRVFGGERVSI